METTPAKPEIVLPSSNITDIKIKEGKDALFGLCEKIGFETKSWTNCKFVYIDQSKDHTVLLS